MNEHPNEETYMQPAIADFMIHVNETLSDADMTRLADSVCNGDCVMSACVSQDDPHLMIVNYDSNCGSVRDIIGRVSRMGVHAQAVGL
jgi:hypothetical protein